MAQTILKGHLCTDFTEVVENLGRSDDNMIVMKKCLNSLYAPMVSCAKMWIS